MKHSGIPEDMTRHQLVQPKIWEDPADSDGRCLSMPTIGSSLPPLISDVCCPAAPLITARVLFPSHPNHSLSSPASAPLPNRTGVTSAIHVWFLAPCKHASVSKLLWSHTAQLLDRRFGKTCRDSAWISSLQFKQHRYLESHHRNHMSIHQHHQQNRQRCQCLRCCLYAYRD